MRILDESNLDKFKSQGFDVVKIHRKNNVLFVFYLAPNLN